MKLRNIILAIACFFTAFSCSMENDTIMNDVENSIEETTEMYTAIDFGLALSDMATKSTTTITNDNDQKVGEDEEHITSFDLFIVENNKVINIVRESGQVAGEGTGAISLKNTEFITKYKKGRTLTAYMFINLTSESHEDILGNITVGSSVSDVENVLNAEISGKLTANELIKVGKKDFTFDENYHHEKSPSGFKDEWGTWDNNKITNISVPVHHVAARLDFGKFSYTTEGFVKAPEVSLLKAEFRNIQTKGYLNKKQYSSSVIGGPVSIGNKLVTDNQINPSLTAYSYSSDGFNNQKYVELYIKVRVKDNDVVKEYEKVYTVNPDGKKNGIEHNYVKAGYLYNLSVNWTITPKWADSTIEFYTKDWEYHSLGEVEL